MKSVMINLTPFGDPAVAEQAADVARNAYLDALHASDMVAKTATADGVRAGVAWLMDLARDNLARRDYAGCYANAMILLECVANGFQPIQFNVVSRDGDAEDSILPVLPPRQLH